MEHSLSAIERSILLRLAREALVQGVVQGRLSKINIENLPDILKEKGASFVTLTRNGELRGCIGTLEPYLPLFEDVREHSVAAALQDYRFPNVQPNELDKIKIEISRLTIPQPLEYDLPTSLPKCLKPGIDGVVLRDGFHKATFLPQVWEKISDPEEFLDHLCMKMGVPPGYWRTHKMRVEIYRVEEFSE